jgi:hypothetical protein
MDKFIENLDLQAEGLWFPIVIGMVLIVTIIFMRKRISWKEIFFIFGVIGYMTWMIDIGVAAQLDIFDLGNPQKEGIPELLTYGIIPSAFAVIFLNYFKQDKKWGYVLLFTILSFLFEWGMVQVGMMKLKGWKTWWSIPVFLAMYGYVLPWMLGFLRKEFKTYEGTERKFSLNLGRKQKAK